MEHPLTSELVEVHVKGIQAETWAKIRNCSNLRRAKGEKNWPIYAVVQEALELFLAQEEE